MNRKTFLKLAGALGAAAALGLPIARKAEAMDDALTRKALADLDAFVSWLGTERGYIGEVGIPQTTPKSRASFADDAQWSALGEAWYQHADVAKLWVTAQEASEIGYNFPYGGYFADVFMAQGSLNQPSPKALSRPGNQADLIKRHVSPGQRGLNFFGAQRWDRATNTNANPGTYNRDYWYPTVNDYPSDPAVNGGQNSFEYLYSQGVRLMRVGFRWERMQPKLFGPLDLTELGHFLQCVDNATAAGVRIVADLHNYGQYYTASGKLSLNSAGLPDDALVDFWLKMQDATRGNATVLANDLMNEPFNDGGIVADAGKTQAQTWERITQKVINAIRQAGFSRRIMVPVYAGIESTAAAHPSGPWATGTNLTYTAHAYMDQARYGRLPPSSTLDPDTGKAYAKEPGTGGGHYAHSYDSDNVLASYRGF